MFATKTILGLLNWKIAALLVCGFGFLVGTPLISGCGRAGDVAEQILEGVGAEGFDGADVGEGVDGRVSNVSGSPATPAVTPPNTSSVAPLPSIAVIDVNRIAQEIAVEQINWMLDVEEQASRQQLNAMQMRFQQEYNVAAQQAGNQPTQQDEADLQSLYQSHMQQLNAERDRSQQALRDFHTQLKQEFIESVRSIAAAVAKSKGIPTVMTTGQVFSIEENYDITEEVIIRMKEALLEQAAINADTANSADALR